MNTRDPLLSTVAQTIRRHHLLAHVADQSNTDLPHVLVALSGGADSVVLLHALHTLGYTLSALHLNHNLRGSEAHADQQFCEQLCNQLHIALHVVSEDVADYATTHKLSIEQAGRTLRYQALENHRTAIGATAIATGHHADDTAETLLLNLIRGTGLAGLTGIPPMRRSIIRPLIDCTRADIEAYTRRHQLHYQTDSTNHDTLYTRNKIRHELLPLLQQINPKINQTLKQTADLLSADHAYLEHVAQETWLYATAHDWHTPTDSLTLNVESFKYADPSIRARVLRQAVMLVAGKGLGTGTTELTHAHIDSLTALLHKQSGKAVHLPSNITATKSYETVIFSQKKGVTTTPAFCYNICLGYGEGTCVYIKEHNLYVSLSHKPYPDTWAQPNPVQILQNLYTKPIQYDRIAEAHVAVRTKQPDDYVNIPNVGRQSLKKFFTNNKIPTHQRQPMLIARGSQVLHMPGLYWDTTEPTGQHRAYLQIWRPMTPLFTEKEITEKVKELGQRIRADYAFKPVTLVLDQPEGLFFLADLARELDTSMTQVLSTLFTNTKPLETQHVLVLSVRPTAERQATLKHVALYQPRSVKTICLLDEPKHPSDYTGFSIEQAHSDPLVGYGLSHNHQHSNLKFIATLPNQE